MKKCLIVVVMLMFVVAVPLVGMGADYMSPGFITRAEVTDGLTANVGGWFWTWPNVVNGFGVNGTGELGNKLLKNLAVGAGVSYDRLKWTESDDKWSNIGIAGYGKYQILTSEEMKKKVEFLPINLSVLGGVKFNIYTFTINGEKYTIGDDISGYNFYDNFIVFNAVGLVDYPLKYVTDADFLKNVTISGYSGLINSSIGGGIDIWYAPEKKNFSIRLGWIPFLGVSANVLFAL